MPSRAGLGVVVVAAVMVTSIVALPLLGGGLGSVLEGSETGEEASALEGGGDLLESVDTANDAAGSTDSGGVQAGPGVELVSMAAAESGSSAELSISQEHETAVEDGVDEGIELAQSQGVEVSQEQRATAVEAATDAVVQHQEAEIEQVQRATAGAVHGSLMQAQAVEAEGMQSAVAGATGGALSQYQTVEASQMQSASWGAAHGALAQKQRVTVEQIQVATYGAAAGAASEAGEKGIDRTPKIQEAAQGAAYGVLDQYQRITVEQRQEITLEHVRHAAAGASAGALEGSTEAVLEQEQVIEIEQHQRVDIKQVQKAAKGAAKGALVQKQTVTVEQTQAAARGAGKGSLKQVQSVRIEQVQRISITMIQEASFGAAKGAIVQSQEATVEQIQAAADGAAGGTLVQHQEISITQIQYAATGASKGVVESAIQYQVVEVEQIQAAARGAGEGAVLQKQVVDVTQVQALASGTSSGTLAQHQEATVTQLQVASRSAAQETARAIQYQRVSITQLQVLSQETAADTTAYAVSEDTDDETQLVQFVEVEVVQKVEEIDELEGTATITFSDQESDGESVVVDDVELSEGGFVAIYDGMDVDADPDGVIGVSSYLESGDHEDLEIELADPLAESGPLVAVVHHDTTGDETFQYGETDGAEDEPYVADGGGPVLDAAFVTVEEPTEDEASLSVSDQEGDGETLVVDEANASVEYVVAAEYDGERVDSDSFDAGEPVEPLELDLEPALEENATVDVSVRSVADDEVLASESIEYTVVDAPPDDADATLAISDQDGSGEAVVVEQASADVPFAIIVTDEDGEIRGESVPFEANEVVENESIGIDPPLEEDATVEVAVVSLADLGGDDANSEFTENPGLETLSGDIDASVASDTVAVGESESLDDVPVTPLESVDVDDAPVLESETIEYTVEDVPPEFDVEFVDCFEANVTGSFEDGDTVIVATGFYESSGFGNTMGEYAITVGDDVDAPLEGTIVFEVGEEYEITETDDGATVEVPPGEFGAAITGISSPEAIPGEIDYPNPDAADCLEQVRPDLPDLDVAETTPTDDAIDVTFEYENPNDADLIVDSEFLEGTTDDEPPEELSADGGEFTVEWTPADDDERLVWRAGMGFYDYDEEEWPTAETDAAGEIDPGEPFFGVSIVETNSPVEEGETLEVVAEVANAGDADGTQEVELAVDEVVVDAATVSLEPGDVETVALEYETVDVEPGEYTATVSSDDESAEIAVTIEPAGEPAAFVVSDLSAPETAEPGETVEVDATIENEGDLEGTAVATYAVNDQPIADATIELEGEESTVVTFASTLPEGESTHSVAVDGSELATTISAAGDTETDGETTGSVETDGDSIDETVTDDAADGTDAIGDSQPQTFDDAGGDGDGPSADQDDDDPLETPETGDEAGTGDGTGTEDDSANAAETEVNPDEGDETEASEGDEAEGSGGGETEPNEGAETEASEEAGNGETDAAIQGSVGAGVG
ncbi:DUF7282 domain-containing protein [Natrarchaeobius chitinivorans]|uniref:CARDB domain-containing protein n=1 Tax=Natrarchaeobius chitinivorans TaxID=1679083 RepID=A0A3N6NFY0_NATCH|nr:CARDB domain-containing protein [Natrarchaeobius chitinivorans]RQG97902.1 hypothetical protein EA473_01525 [Natrarchaeobius chitinivorans]